MYYLFFFSHVQQWAPLLAPVMLAVSAIYIAARNGLNRNISNRQILLLVVIFYLLFNLVLNVNLKSDFAYLTRLIATDARLLYLLFLSLILSAIRLYYADIEKMMRAAIWVTGIICALSLISFVTTPLTFQEFDFGSIGTASGRWIVGFLETKNPFAGSLGAVFLLIIAWMFVRGGFDVLNVGVAGTLLVCILIFFCLLLARSTGYLFGALVALGYMILFETHHKSAFRFQNYMKYAVLMVSVIALAAFVAIYHHRLGDVLAGHDINTLRRLAIFHRSVEVITQSPLLGLGPGAVEAYQLDVHTVIPGLIAVRENALFFDEFYWIGVLPVGQHTHNIFLQIVSDYGLIGLGLLGYYFFKTLFAPIGDQPDSENLAAIRFIARVQFVYLVASGLVAGYSISSPSTAWIFYVLLGWLSQAQLCGSAVSRQRH